MEGRRNREGEEVGDRGGLQVREPSDQAAVESTQNTGVGGKAFREVLLCETMEKCLQGCRLAPGAQGSSQAVPTCESGKCPDWVLAIPGNSHNPQAPPLNHQPHLPPGSSSRGEGAALWPLALCPATPLPPPPDPAHSGLWQVLPANLLPPTLLLLLVNAEQHLLTPPWLSNHAGHLTG